MNPKILTQSRLKELLHYDSETGLFTWLRKHGTKAKMSQAGYVNERGYVDISVDGKNYRAHRLAWLYVNGNFPIGVIDHIDGDKENNRINNLRDVHNSVNLLAHRKLNSNNTSGFKGVHKNPKGWRAEVTVRGKLICLGTYETPREASIAYISAKFFIEKMPWQGLTDTEIANIYCGEYLNDTDFARVIEAKLRDKNG